MVNLEAELTPEFSNEIELLARSVERLGLAIPAMMLLEACKPLHRLAVHTISMLPQSQQVLEHPFAKIISDRRNAELLIERLEKGALA